MRVAPIDYRSLWTCMNCSILRNLLDLFSTSLLLADPAIPGLSMFGANTIIHTLQSKRRLSLQGKISKQPFSAGWNWLCQDEKRWLLNFLIHVMSYKSTILTPCWSDFRSTLRSPCPQICNQTIRHDKEPSAPPRPSTQMAQVRSLLDISRCFRLATSLRRPWKIIRIP